MFVIHGVGFVDAVEMQPSNVVLVAQFQVLVGITRRLHGQIIAKYAKNAKNRAKKTGISKEIPVLLRGRDIRGGEGRGGSDIPLETGVMSHR